MDEFSGKHWGLLLDTLAQMADLERQLVVQVQRPAAFVPDELLNNWYETFRAGQGLSQSGLSPQIAFILLDFDAHLSGLIDIVPHDAPDREDYIRHDEAWRTICELADWTLTRIAEQSAPEQVRFCPN